MNKLLKFSPDEQKQIEIIAKGIFKVNILKFKNLNNFLWNLGSLVDQNSSWSSLFMWSQGT